MNFSMLPQVVAPVVCITYYLYEEYNSFYIKLKLLHKLLIRKESVASAKSVTLLNNF